MTLHIMQTLILHGCNEYIETLIFWFFHKTFCTHFLRISPIEHKVIIFIVKFHYNKIT